MDNPEGKTDGEELADQMEVDRESPMSSSDISVLSRSESAETADSWEIVPKGKDSSPNVPSTDANQQEIIQPTEQKSTPICTTTDSQWLSDRDYRTAANPTAGTDQLNKSPTIGSQTPADVRRMWFVGIDTSQSPSDGHSGDKTVGDDNPPANSTADLIGDWNAIWDVEMNSSGKDPQTDRKTTDESVITSPIPIVYNVAALEAPMIDDDVQKASKPDIPDLNESGWTTDNSKDESMLSPTDDNENVINFLLAPEGVEKSRRWQSQTATESAQQQLQTGTTVKPTDKYPTFEDLGQMLRSIDVETTQAPQEKEADRNPSGLDSSARQFGASVNNAGGDGRQVEPSNQPSYANVAASSTKGSTMTTRSMSKHDLAQRDVIIAPLSIPRDNLSLDLSEGDPNSVMVSFQVFIPNSFQLKESDIPVIIFIGYGYDHDCFPLYLQPFDEDWLLGKISLTLGRKHLQNRRYKYGVMRNGNRNLRDTDWEKFHSTSDPYKNRHLNVPNDFKQNVFSQIDFLMEPQQREKKSSQKGMVSRIVSGFLKGVTNLTGWKSREQQRMSDRMVDSRFVALENFLPRWSPTEGFKSTLDPDNLSIVAIAEEFQLVTNRFRQYLRDSSDYYQVDKEEVKLTEHLIDKFVFISDIIGKMTVAPATRIQTALVALVFCWNSPVRLNQFPIARYFKHLQWTPEDAKDVDFLIESTNNGETDVDKIVAAIAECFGRSAGSPMFVYAIPVYNQLRRHQTGEKKLSLAALGKHPATHAKWTEVVKSLTEFGFEWQRDPKFLDCLLRVFADKFTWILRFDDEVVSQMSPLAILSWMQHVTIDREDRKQLPLLLKLFANRLYEDSCVTCSAEWFCSATTTFVVRIVDFVVQSKFMKLETKEILELTVQICRVIDASLVYLDRLDPTKTTTLQAKSADWLKQLESLVGDIVSNQFAWSKDPSEEASAWATVFDLKLQLMSDSYRQSLETIFTRRLRKEPNGSVDWKVNFLAACMEIHLEMKSLCEKELFRLVKESWDSGKSGPLMKLLTGNPSLRHVFSEVFLSRWNEGQIGDDLLARLLAFRGINKCLEHFGDSDDTDVAVKDLIKQLVAVIRETADSCEGLSVTVRRLETLQISSNRQKFVELVKLLKIDTVSTLDSLLKTIDEFDCVRRQLTLLLNLMTSVKTFEEELRAKLRVSNSEVRMCDLIDVSDKGILQPQLLAYFGVDPKWKDQLPKLELLCDSRIYLYIVGAMIRRLPPPNLSELLKLALVETVTEAEALLKQLVSGEIQISQLDQLRTQFSATGEGELLGHFKQLCTALKCPSKPFEKPLKNYAKVLRYRSQCDAAELLLDLVEMLNLPTIGFGELLELEKLGRDNEFESKKLCEVTGTESLDVGEFIQNLTPERIASVQALMDSSDLVDWINKSIKAEKELQAFVGLASDAMELSVISTLNVAVSSYAPLIWLPNDSGWTQLQKALDSLFKSLEADPTLTEKLLSSSKNLGRIQQSWKTIGSFEKKSIGEVKDINIFGRYRLGMIETSGVNLNNLVTLVVSKDPNEKQSVEKRWSFEELNDLYTRLTLIGGRMAKENTAKEQIDQFGSLFQLIAKLTELYRQHWDGGNVFFLQFLAEIHCDKDLEVSCHISFGGGSDMIKLRGSLGPENSASMLIEMMKTSLNEWRDTLMQYRQDWPHLNLFTDRQVAMLRQQLANPDVLLPQTAMMLMSLGCNITKKNLAEARSHVDVGQVVEQMEVGRKTRIDPEVIETLRDYGISDAMAIHIGQLVNWDLNAALKYVSEANLDDITAANQSGEATNEDGQTASEILLSQANSVENEWEIGMEQLLSTWRKHQWQQQTTTVDQFISLRHLTGILDQLSRRHVVDSEQKDLILPGWIRRDDINVLIVPTDDVIKYLLAAYQAGGEFPAQHQVLMCRQTTTAEDLELFFMRMRQAVDPRLYSLAFPERLPSAMCRQLERLAEGIIQAHNSATLALFCGEENFHNSPVGAMWTGGQRNLSGLANWTEVAKFIRQRLAKRQAMPNDQVESLLDGFKSVLVTSVGCGQGKSLLVRRQVELLQSRQKRKVELIKVPIYPTSVDSNLLVDLLLSGYAENPDYQSRYVRVFHLDFISSFVPVDEILFELLVLGCLTDAKGRVWRFLPQDCYAVELSSPPNKYLMPVVGERENPDEIGTFHFTLPVSLCLSPQRSAVEADCFTRPGVFVRRADAVELQSDPFQRCFYHLSNQIYQRGVTPLADPTALLNLLIRQIGINSPSWVELKHFVDFLDSQLRDFEQSDFCSAVASRWLPGFDRFVMTFLVEMAQDFATRSLKISEAMAELNADQLERLEGYSVKRKWEERPHPYLFFNEDPHRRDGHRDSFSFFGCTLDNAGNLVEKNRVVKPRFAHPALVVALTGNGVDLKEFNQLSDVAKLQKLQRVLGVPETTVSPNRNYEITADCAVKICAIHMRLRCGIPVCIMGETGCGKTALVQFLYQLKGQGKTEKNLVVFKVHGGTSYEHIESVIQSTLKLAEENWKNHKIETGLLCDEANSTDAMGMFKEIMCDGTLRGKDLNLKAGHLQLLIAVNPYKRHSEDMIRKMECAGFVRTESANPALEKFGTIPLRELVYRVRPLPASLIPLAWDFGTLTAEVEAVYIGQIVAKFCQTLPDFGTAAKSLTEILVASQLFMRAQKAECSYVSLRNVERTLLVIDFLYRHKDFLFKFSDAKNIGKRQKANVARAVAIGVAICYRVSLPDCRKEFDLHIAKFFTEPLQLPTGVDSVAHEIELFQNVLVDSLDLEATVARNLALCENVLMMFICAELRIPLFLVGKPGSSKSLAKTIVESSMRGQTSQHPVLSQFKQAQLLSYQCSPLSTSEGVEAIFLQCAQYQKDVNLSQHVAVAVFDEIGLAEDSPNLPLKALHGLLEEGYRKPGETAQPYHKVGFVGISNWALDPAQLNRGIFVSRVLPSKEELLRTARAICESGKVAENIDFLIEPLTNAYHEVYQKQHWTDFYGLRDFYGLIKMIFDIASLPEKSGRRLRYVDVMKAIQHNFSGNDETIVRGIFARHLQSHINDIDDTRLIPVKQLVKENLIGFPSGQRDSRYLLILTESFWALRLLKCSERLANSIVIFGSAFRRDCLYTQVCSNINRIKLAMENGTTVVLLNLESLYESLYDLLNQSFINLGNDRFVDLGLGIHRLKCSVHKDFRLIVIANREDVRGFPAALINRLEKHSYTAVTDMSSAQKDLVDRLQGWIEDFVAGQGDKLAAADYFVGFHHDTPASLIAELTDINANWSEEEILREAQKRLIQCATPEAIVKFWSRTKTEAAEGIFQLYFEQQSHNGLLALLRHKLADYNGGCRSYEVTTHSRSLSNADSLALQQQLAGVIEKLDCLQLEDYDTEAEFSIDINKLFDSAVGKSRLLVIQCLSGNNRERLLACAKYRIQEKIKEESRADVVVVFLVTLNRGGGAKKFVATHAGMWDCHHVDDIDDFSSSTNGQLSDYRGTTISQLIEDYQRNPDGSAIDFRRILKSSVHLTVALLVDLKEKSSRKADRVELLLESLNSADFFDMILNRLVRLQQEKELATPAAKDWFNRLAADLTMILENRTFKLATFKRLQIALMPLFAGLLSQMDVAANCDHLNSTGWQREIFLRLFDCADLISLHYSHESSVFFTTGENPRQRDKFPIARPSDFDFACQFPFSWLLKEKVERLISDHNQIPTKLQQIENDEGETAEDAAEIENVEEEPTDDYLLGQFEWGRLLLSLDEDLLQHYLNDLIFWSFPVTSQLQAELIGAWLWLGMEKKSVTAGHTRIRQLRSRVESFLSLVTDERWSYLTLKLSEEQKMLDENHQQLDMCAITLLLYTLEESVAECCTSADDDYTVVGRKCVELIQSATAHVEQLLIQLADITGVAKLRFRWQKLTIFHLFMLHTMHVDYRFKIQGLWNLMGRWKADANDFVTGFDQLLKVWNKLLRTDIFKLPTGVVSCKFCNKPVGHIIDTATVDLLPCLHAVHKDCLQQMFTLKQQRCPQCQERIPEDYKRVAEANMSEANMRYKRVRSALGCFYVDLLQTFVFRRDQRPSDQVVTQLLGYVTHIPSDGGIGTTSICFPVVDDIAIDPSPVVRSFLLQLLLQYRYDDVAAQLSEYLRNAHRFVRQDEDLANLVFMCVSVRQDMRQSQLSSLTLLERIAAVNPDVKALNRLPLESERFDNFNDLVSIATFRIVAEIYCDVIAAVLNKQLMYKQVAVFCTQVESKPFWKENPSARQYLCKQLHRSHGNELFTQARNQDKFKWIIPAGLGVDENVADWGHIGGGENYTAVKHQIFLTVSNNSAAVDVDKTDPTWKSSLFLGCFYAEWTLRRPEISQFLQQSLNRLFTGDRLANWTTLTTQMANRPELSRNNSYLPQLIAHVVTAVSTSNFLCGSTQFFQELLADPRNCSACYFPSMAENTTMATAAAAKTLGMMTTLNRCPNGHLYAIADCGQPNQQGICPDCGAPIGGGLGRYQYQAGNRVVAEAEIGHNRTGHFLLTNVITPERQLNLQETVVVRAILHSSLLAAAILHPGEVSQLLSDPTVDPVAYLYGLLASDLRQLGERFSVNVDESALMLMLIWADVAKGTAVTMADPMLRDQNTRGYWERRFVDTFVTPILQNLPVLLENVKKTAVDAKGSTLTALMYELIPMSQMSRSLWGFRRPNTFESLFDQLRKSLAEANHPAELAILRLFTQHETHLQPIKYLPNIIRLQMFLSAQLKGTVDPHELAHMTIGNFLERLDTLDREKVQQWVEDFFECWKMCISEIRKFTKSEHGAEKLPPDCFNLTGNCRIQPLLFITPVPVDIGRCGLTLVEYLIDRQNSFVDGYRQIVNSQQRFTDVDVRKCTEAVTVSYERQRDLLPLLLLHRILELNVGVGRIDTTFDLPLLQRRIDAAYLNGAVKFNRNSIPLLPTKQTILSGIFAEIRKTDPPQMSGHRKRDLLGQMPTSLPDIYQLCELVDLLIKFSLSFESTESLTALVERLNLRNHPGFIEKLMSNLTTEDLIGVWQVAMLKRNILVVQSGGLPRQFNKLSRYGVAMEEADKKALIEAKPDVCDLLCSLTEFLHIHLPRELPNLNRLDNDLGTSLQEFCNWDGADLPSSICLRHTIDVWKILEEKFRRAQ